ncbi:phage portal protein [Virgibacillus halodenitrificans]|uniref:phage portal protein n=1 Tax=Virgibacillus halodenitrificans TaxID=1482 RepID=UPI0006873AAE|nr:phage portal protein [Virgibacillus halodenitrificans]
MFHKIMNFLRKGAAYLGLVKSIEKLTDHKDISLNEEMFNKIEVWKDLYKGYHEPFHQIRYKTIDGEKARKMDTLMMAKTVAAEMASLVYNEKCEISIDDDTVTEFTEDVFKHNKFDKKFQDYLEYSFAHGGMVIKPYIEDDKIMLSFVTADCFIPISWRNDSIYEAVFPFEFKKRDKKYTHLEWHLWENGVYVIRNEVYESQNGDDLGVKVPLADHFPELEEEVYISGLKRSIFSYFKPNSANNVDTNSPLGISIYANAIDTMKAIDTAFDSFNREFRLGKKRIVIPAHMVKVVIDPETGQSHRYFDDTDETYEAFNNGDMDENKIQEMNITLRVEEHISAINALLNLFAMQTGFSSGTFTFDGQSMKTATEVISEQSKTFKSKQSHEVIIEAALQELIGSIVAMGQLYGMINAPGEYEVTVTFDDSIAEDKEAEIKQQVQLLNAGIQSKKRAIMKVHGLTEEEAMDMLKEIIEEERQQSPDVKELQAQGAIFGPEE